MVMQHWLQLLLCGDDGIPLILIQLLAVTKKKRSVR